MSNDRATARAMRLVRYATAVGLLMAISACQDFGEEWFKHPPEPTDHPFATNQSQPTSCMSADQTCIGSGNSPSVQAPRQNAP